MRRVLFALIALLAFLLLPRLVGAAVLINEIAWMGGDESPNDEWIELFNDGDSAIDVSGWQLTDNASLTITLSGSIGSGQYALLERTDDESAPGAAFHIYSGALGNDGRTLTLLRSDGSVADQVAGGEGWAEVGGNNSTKDTAQLTDAGWITAVPTPGKKNSTVETEGVNTGGVSGGEAAAHTKNSIGSKTNISFGIKTESLRVSLQNPDTELTLSIPENVVTFPGRSVSFEVQGSGIGDTLIDMIDYEWNFGDGGTSTKNSPSHTYAFPGTYVAVVRGSVLRHEAAARGAVTVLPYRLSLERIGERVFIHNDAAYETDIGELTLTDGTSHITIPKDTLLLPRASLTLGAATFKHPNLLTLRQKDGTVLARVEPPIPQLEIAQAPERTATEALFPEEKTIEQLNTISTTTTTSTIFSSSTRSTLSPASTTTAMLASPSAAGEKDGGFNLPLLGLLGVIGLGLLATFAARIG